jgi:hypothetical protein
VSEWLTIATLGDVDAYSDTTVEAGVEYEYSLVAFNTEGDSDPSNVLSVLIPAEPGATIERMLPALQSVKTAASEAPTYSASFSRTLPATGSTKNGTYTHRDPATFYVSPDGSDAGSGLTVNGAWQTLAKVQAEWDAGNFIPDDEILFEGGRTFSGRLNLWLSETTVFGTPSTTFTLGSFGVGRAKLAGTTGERCVEAANIHGFRVLDLELEGDGTKVNTNHTGLMIAGHGAGNFKIQNPVVRNCRIHGFTYGLYLFGGAADSSGSGSNGAVIEDTDIYNCGTGLLTDSWTSSTTRAVHTNVLIQRCNAYNNPGRGTGTGESGSGFRIANVEDCLVEHCRAWGNGAANTASSGGPFGLWCYNAIRCTFRYCESYNNTSGTKNDGGGFDLDGACTDCVIEYCYAHDNTGVGFMLWGYTGAPVKITGCVIRYCVGIRNGYDTGAAGFAGQLMTGGNNSGVGVDGLDVYGNTFVMPDAPVGGQNQPVVWINSNSTNVRLRNNILIATGVRHLVHQVPTSGTFIYSGNNYYSSTNEWSCRRGSTNYATLAAWRAINANVEGTSDGTDVDPLLVDFSLSPTVGNTLQPWNLPSAMLQAGSTMPAGGINLRTHYTLPAQDFFGNAIPASGDFTAVGAATTAEAILYFTGTFDRSLPPVQAEKSMLFVSGTFAASNVIATPEGPRRIRLDYTKGVGAVQYRIERLRVG